MLEVHSRDTKSSLYSQPCISTNLQNHFEKSQKSMHPKIWHSYKASSWKHDKQASNVHSWYTYKQASLNYNIHGKIFLNQMPMNRKAQF